MKTSFHAVMVLLALIGLASQKAVAADNAEGWRYQLTPYAWAIGLEGRVRPTAGFPTVEADLSFRELIEDLDAALFLSGTARKNDWLLLGDITWTSSSQEGRVAVPGAPIRFDARGKVRQSALTLAGGRTVLRNDRAHVDLYTGLRFSQVTAQADIPRLSLSARDRSRWVDALVGVRLNIALTPKLSTIMQADVGGGGVLGGADTTIQALIVANWQLSDQAYLSAGYRYLDFDYRRNGRIVDVAQSGPLLGVTWKF
ncbi:MAG: hypothetical protein ACK4IT_03360 [Thioalkalivibrionaceae bacterium]